MSSSTSTFSRGREDFTRISETDWYKQVQETIPTLQWTILQLSDDKRVATGMLRGNFQAVIQQAKTVISVAEKLIQQMKEGVVEEEPLAFHAIAYCYDQLKQVTEAAKSAVADEAKGETDLLPIDGFLGTGKFLVQLCWYSSLSKS